MPESVPLPDAAVLYFPFHLAWLGLFDRAELQSGETVLVHAAAGGSGSAAVQLAKHAGARVIRTLATPPSVHSTGTTASAPLGTGAPVMIRTAVPGDIANSLVCPAAASPTTGRWTGWSAVAVATSR